MRTADSAVRIFVVEVTGLEPTTSWSRTKRATKLRYTSIIFIIITEGKNFVKHKRMRCARFSIVFVFRLPFYCKSRTDT